MFRHAWGSGRPKNRPKVGIAYDFFRSPLLGQWDGETNGRWLNRLLSPMIGFAGGQTHFLSEKGAAPQIAVGEALHLGAVAGTTEGWAQAYAGTAALGRVYEPLREYDLIVGYELAPSLMRFLSAAGIPFLEFSIDPIRFAGDLFFAVRCNHEPWVKELEAREVRDQDLLPEVGLFRSRLERAEWERTGGIPPGGPNATLFVGQADVDASLVVGGSLQRVSEHFERLKMMVPPEQAVLLKPHPFGHTHADVRFLHHHLPSAMLCNDNVYGLLHSPAIQQVITLSSGVAREAELFGKPSVRLITPDGDSARLGPNVVSRSYRLNFRDLDVRFWSRVLFGKSLAPRTLTHSISSGALRRSLGVSWAFSENGVMPAERRASLEEPIEFGIGRRGLHLLTFGWREPEDGIVWGREGLSAILLNVEPSSLPLAVNLDLEAVVSFKSPLCVSLSARGALTSPEVTFQFSQSGARTVELELEAGRDGASGLTEIVLVVRDAQARPWTAKAEEGRGIGLKAMRIMHSRRAVQAKERSAVA